MLASAPSTGRPLWVPQRLDEPKRVSRHFLSEAEKLASEESLVCAKIRNLLIRSKSCAKVYTRFRKVRTLTFPDSSGQNFSTVKTVDNLIKEEALLLGRERKTLGNFFLISTLLFAEARQRAMKRITRFISMMVFCHQEVATLTRFQRLNGQPSNSISSSKLQKIDLDIHWNLKIKL